MALPTVSTNTLAGMIEEVAAPPYNGKADLPALADSLQLEIDDLFPVAETLQLLRFAELAEGDIKLTPAGQALRGDRTSTSARSCSATICSLMCRSRSASAACSTSARRITRPPPASARSSRIT